MELMLLSQFNVDSPLPTIFELIAALRLGDTLADAFAFALSSAATRLPRLAPAVHYADELYVGLHVLLQRPFLLYTDATMAENAFGLKRSRIVSRKPTATTASPAAAAPTGDEGDAADDAAAAAAQPRDNDTDAGMGATADTNAAANVRLGPVTARQRLLGLLVATLLPYLRRRLFQWARALRDESPDAVAARQAAENARPWLKPIHKAVAACYPVAHAAMELATLLVHLAYLADRTPYASWENMLLGVVLRRATRSDMAALQGDTRAMRTVKWAQTGLLAIAVAFRLVDWWNAGDGRDASSTIAHEALRTPPPPAPVQPATSSSLPAPGHCPVCTQPVVNAAVNAASGYVCCYPCLHQHVAERGECPVTRVRTSEGQIRRLHDAA